MPVGYHVQKSFRLTGDDSRRLSEIGLAVGMAQAEAMRFAIELAWHFLNFVVANDPDVILVEYQHRRGRKTFPEQMTHEENINAVVHVREAIGPTRFDLLLKRGRQQAEYRRHDLEIFLEAKKALEQARQGPYQKKDVVEAIAQAGRCTAWNARRIFDAQWDVGNLRQPSLGMYDFADEAGQGDKPYQ